MILKYFFGLGGDKSFLGTASRDEGRGMFVADKDLQVKEMHHLRELFIKEDDTLLESANVIANSSG